LRVEQRFFSLPLAPAASKFCITTALPSLSYALLKTWTQSLKRFCGGTRSRRSCFTFADSVALTQLQTTNFNYFFFFFSFNPYTHQSLTQISK
jgi:hypothetical protein